jgi:hypothetical protein
MDRLEAWDRHHHYPIEQTMHDYGYRSSPRWRGLLHRCHGLRRDRIR